MEKYRHRRPRLVDDEILGAWIVAAAFVLGLVVLSAAQGELPAQLPAMLRLLTG